jgi:hypothetical protein
MTSCRGAKAYAFGAEFLVSSGMRSVEAPKLFLQREIDNFFNGLLTRQAVVGPCRPGGHRRP